MPPFRAALDGVIKPSWIKLFSNFLFKSGKTRLYNLNQGLELNLTWQIYN